MNDKRIEQLKVRLAELDSMIKTKKEDIHFLNRDVLLLTKQITKLMITDKD